MFMCGSDGSSSNSAADGTTASPCRPGGSSVKTPSSTPSSSPGSTDGSPSSWKSAADVTATSARESDGSSATNPPSSSPGSSGSATGSMAASACRSDGSSATGSPSPSNSWTDSMTGSLFSSDSVPGFGVTSSCESAADSRTASSCRSGRSSVADSAVPSNAWPDFPSSLGGLAASSSGSVFSLDLATGSTAASAGSSAGSSAAASPVPSRASLDVADSSSGESVVGSPGSSVGFVVDSGCSLSVASRPAGFVVWSLYADGAPASAYGSLSSSGFGAGRTACGWSGASKASAGGGSEWSVGSSDQIQSSASSSNSAGADCWEASRSARSRLRGPGSGLSGLVRVGGSYADGASSSGSRSYGGGVVASAGSSMRVGDSSVGSAGGVYGGRGAM